MFENVEYAREYGQSAAKRINLSGKPGKPSPIHLPLEMVRDQVRERRRGKEGVSLTPMTEHSLIGEQDYRSQAKK